MESKRPELWEPRALIWVTRISALNEFRGKEKRKKNRLLLSLIHRAAFSGSPDAEIRLAEHVSENHGIGGSIPPLERRCPTPSAPTP